MNIIYIALAIVVSFTCGYLYVEPPTSECPDPKERPSIFDAAFEKSMRSCQNDGYADYVCYHYLVGGAFPRATPTPEPTPTTKYKYKYEVPSDNE